MSTTSLLFNLLFLLLTISASEAKLTSHQVAKALQLKSRLGNQRFFCQAFLANISSVSSIANPIRIHLSTSALPGSTETHTDTISTIDATKYDLNLETFTDVQTSISTIPTTLISTIATLSVASPAIIFSSLHTDVVNVTNFLATSTVSIPATITNIHTEYAPTLTETVTYTMVSLVTAKLSAPAITISSTTMTVVYATPTTTTTTVNAGPSTVIYAAAATTATDISTSVARRSVAMPTPQAVNQDSSASASLFKRKRKKSKFIIPHDNEVLRQACSLLLYETIVPQLTTTTQMISIKGPAMTLFADPIRIHETSTLQSTSQTTMSPVVTSRTTQEIVSSVTAIVAVPTSITVAVNRTISKSVQATMTLTEYPPDKTIRYLDLTSTITPIVMATDYAIINITKYTSIITPTTTVLAKATASVITSGPGYLYVKSGSKKGQYVSKTTSTPFGKYIISNSADTLFDFDSGSGKIHRTDDSNGVLAHEYYGGGAGGGVTYYVTDSDMFYPNLVHNLTCTSSLSEFGCQRLDNPSYNQFYLADPYLFFGQNTSSSGFEPLNLLLLSEPIMYN